MTDHNSRAGADTRINRARVGILRRVAYGTITAAGVVGALAMAHGPADDAVQPVSVDVAMERPLQPPVPPGPPVPPPMQEPGQQGPDTGIHDQPPPPAPAEPNENAIYQDILGMPHPPYVNEPCYDPNTV